MSLHQAKIESHVKINESSFLLELNCPDAVQKASPGQFVMLQCGETYDPLLRRPFGIHKVNKKEGLLFIYYEVIGTGTNLLKNMKTNEKISMMGPMGRGFELTENQDILVIGGGMGTAPLLFLVQELNQRHNKMTLLLGAESSSGLEIRNYFADFAQDCFLATDDGSLGYHGFVTDLLQDILKEKSFNRAFACGPHGMLKEIKKITETAKIPCQVSVEARMACGVGVCLGCACKGTGIGYYPKVCTDGPVFWAEEVSLDA